MKISRGVWSLFKRRHFYIRQARTSFEDVDLAFENAARTLGASRFYTFFNVIIPITINSLISGAIMAFARSLGEFGATIMFVGKLSRAGPKTQPLAIYTAIRAIWTSLYAYARLFMHCHNTCGHLLCGHRHGEDPDPAGVQEC